LNGRLKRHGNGNYGHCWFPLLEPIFEEAAVEARFFAHNEGQADHEIRRCGLLALVRQSRARR